MVGGGGAGTGWGWGGRDGDRGGGGGGEVRQEAGAAAEVRTRRPALRCLGSRVSREREKPPDWGGERTWRPVLMAEACVGSGRGRQQSPRGF